MGKEEDMIAVYVLLVGVVAALAQAIVRWVATPRRGQSLVEYAIVVAVIAVGVMAAVQALGGSIASMFTNLAGRLPGL